MQAKSSLNLMKVNSFLVKQRKEELLRKKVECYQSIIHLKKKRPYKILSKLTGLMTKEGKRNSASSIIEKNLISIKKTRTQKDRKLCLHSLFWKFFSKIKPGVQIKKTRVSGRTVFVPSAVKSHTQLGMSLRWWIGIQKSKKSLSKDKNQSSFEESLSLQMIESLNKKGLILQKKDELNKIAEKNRNFLYLSW